MCNIWWEFDIPPCMQVCNKDYKGKSYNTLGKFIN